VVRIAIPLLVYFVVMLRGTRHDLRPRAADSRLRPDAHQQHPAGHGDGGADDFGFASPLPY